VGLVCIRITVTYLKIPYTLPRHHIQPVRYPRYACIPVQSVFLLCLLNLVLRRSLVVYPTQVWWTYPLCTVVICLAKTSYTRLPIMLADALSRCGTPTHLLPCFLLAHTALFVSSLYVWSRSLSSCTSRSLSLSVSLSLCLSLDICYT